MSKSRPIPRPSASSPATTAKDYDCLPGLGVTPVLGTGGDVFYFPKNKDAEVEKGQLAMASMMVSKEVQVAFNLKKGSLPMRADIDLSAANDCMKKGLEILDKSTAVFPNDAQMIDRDSLNQNRDVMNEFFANPAERPNPLFRNLNSKIAALPMMLIVLVVFVGGTVWTVASSFTSIRTLPIFTPQEFYDNWAGMAQYTRLWRTPRWITAITNLAIYGSLYTSFAFVIGFMLAVFMDQKIRLEGLFRTIYLYPFALSFIVTGHVWAWIMNPAFGLEASVRRMGWESFSFDWLTNREMSIYAVVIAGLWQGSGFVMALMLAGLRGIDDDIWKATRVDGIPKWRTYIQVVLPMMRPVLVTTFVIVASGAVRTYDLVVALTQGGPGHSSQLPTLYVYETMFVGALAQGTAASSVMLLATAVILTPWIWVEFVRKRQA